MDVASLLLSAACGATLLVLCAVAFVGGRKSIPLMREMGGTGLLVALFIGVVADSLSASLAQSPPYTTLFLPTEILRIQGLLEDPDLRTRYNVDPRLRYIPMDGSTVINLESEYRLEAGPLRRATIPALHHEDPVRRPAGVAPLSPEGDSILLRQEVSGLYAAAAPFAEDPEAEARLRFTRTASVGLWGLGSVLLAAGLLPLIFYCGETVWDLGRLYRATSGSAYRGGRVGALRLGAAALVRWNFRRASSSFSLGTVGLLAALLGGVIGLRHEDETRQRAHDVFQRARLARVEGKREP